jgi:hypothetical protein
MDKKTQIAASIELSEDFRTNAEVYKTHAGLP